MLEKREPSLDEMFFVMSLRLSDHKVLHNIASSSSFLHFAQISSLFFARISYFQIFDKTIIPFALVGYETGYSQLISKARSWNN